MHHTLARIIGYDGKGRPIREIRGGSVGLPEQPPEGQQGQGPNEDLGDLLGEPVGAGDGGGGDPTDPPAGGAEAPPAWWAAASAQLQQQTQSEIDRRINQLQRRQSAPGQQQQQPQGGHQAPPPPAPVGGVSSADIREARAAYRDAWADTGTRLSPEERDFVNAALGGLIAAELASDPDPDRAGTRVANTIATQVRKLRSGYQTRIVSRLEQVGALDRTKLKPGVQNTPGSGQQKSPATEWQSGADTAQKLLQQRGLVNPTQQTT
jgi:hypothetical protein